ncbi:hypothetical protein [Streptomyces spectabilis]|uniref:Heparin-binding hemagglutinin n=1 Tax=Streptomyces spectabilis TaxID=68270 RepID=A0A5P2XAQ2_STRST|nr:hypothetical protein [Streptomyces spectabilis]MBB5106585.1 hypothetical protein [Streptomyces spectabilis]MCI3903558.1 hypothetical protein [Streptomyces spectabilis]QEV60754.1 hypothetical protein CP982_20180 [Streptomyces spectabilis]GGV48176.1 hypothetical protein GCM10010245_75770 [Streptomyces spectabilis]
MPITEEVRKAVTNPTPLYFVVGSAELALQQAKKVPGAIEQLAAEAPARLEAVRNTNPKDVQDRAAARAKEAREVIQRKVGEFFGVLDTDLKRIGENAQDFALRGVGVAVEYTVQARETYEKVAEHGEQTVRNLRGEAADELVELADTVEPDAPEASATTETTKTSETSETSEASDTSEGAAATKPAAKKTTAKKTTAKKTTPPAK